MPQKKSSKSKNSTRSTNAPIPNRFKTWQAFAIVVLVIILVIVLYKAYDNFQTNQQAKADKILLDRVDQKMRIVYDKIVAEIGEPDKADIGKSCAYTSAEYNSGTLWCGADYYYSYITQGNDLVNRHFDLTQSILSKGGFSSIADTPVQDLDFSGTHSDIHIFLDSQDTNIRCDLYYKISKSNSNSHIWTENYHFSCSKELKKSIYKEIN